MMPFCVIVAILLRSLWRSNNAIGLIFFLSWQFALENRLSVDSFLPAVQALAPPVDDRCEWLTDEIAPAGAAVSRSL